MRYTLFNDFVVCAEGTVVEREVIKQYVTQFGGKVVDDVSARVTHLVVGNSTAGEPTDKINKAQALQIPIVSEFFLRDSIQHEEIQNFKLYQSFPNQEPKDNGNHSDSLSLDISVSGLEQSINPATNEYQDSLAQTSDIVEVLDDDGTEAGQYNQDTISIKKEIEENMKLFQEANTGDPKAPILIRNIASLFDRLFIICKKQKNKIPLHNTLKTFGFYKLLKMLNEKEMHRFSHLIPQFQTIINDEPAIFLECLPIIIVPMLHTSDCISLSPILYHYCQSNPELVAPYIDDLIFAATTYSPTFINIIFILYSVAQKRIEEELPSFQQLFDRELTYRSLLIPLLVNISKANPRALIPFIPSLAKDLRNERTFSILSIFLEITYIDPKQMHPYISQLEAALKSDPNMGSCVTTIYSVIIRDIPPGTTSPEQGLDYLLFDKLINFLAIFPNHQLILTVLNAITNAVEKRKDLLMGNSRYVSAIDALSTSYNTQIRDEVKRIKDILVEEKKNVRAIKQDVKSIKLKIQAGKTIRMIAFEEDTSFGILVDKIRERCQLNKGAQVNLVYKDEQGDPLTVGSQDELDDMLSYYSENKLPALKCELAVISDNRPNSVSELKSPNPVASDISSQKFAPVKGASLSNQLPASNIHNQNSNPTFIWKKGELLGQGAFGKVFMGMDLQSGVFMAVKQISLPQGDSKVNAKIAQEIKNIESEIELMKVLKHKNIVHYLGTEVRDKNLYIFLEYVVGGSLSSLLSKFGALPESLIRVYLTQILEGLQFLHENKVIHRDIKAANILVDDKGSIKLADFGASKVIELQENDNEKHSLKGTPVFMAPEIIRHGQFSGASDIWAVGCVLIELLTGKLPWSNFIRGMNPYQIMYKVANQQLGSPLPKDVFISNELNDMINHCFKLNPKERPSAAELLQHPFIKGEVSLSDLETGQSSVQESANPGAEKSLTTPVSAQQLNPKMTQERINNNVQPPNAISPSEQAEKSYNESFSDLSLSIEAEKSNKLIDKKVNHEGFSNISRTLGNNSQQSQHQTIEKSYQESFNSIPQDLSGGSSILPNENKTYGESFHNLSQNLENQQENSYQESFSSMSQDLSANKKNDSSISDAANTYQESFSDMSYSGNDGAQENNETYCESFSGMSQESNTNPNADKTYQESFNSLSYNEDQQTSEES